MMNPIKKIFLCVATGAVLAPFASAQNLEERLNAVEKKFNALSSDVEAMDLGGLVPKIGQFSDVLGNPRGVGQGANKVYDIEQGISFGGYGEMLFQNQQGGGDEADAQRAILYVGYKFSDKWVFNSELEWEHGSTSTGGSASIEFAYLDYMHSDMVNFRAGLLLSPMGLINQLHEPTAFLASSRPQTEKRMIPSTWREMGAGFYGDVGDFAYQTYAMTALDNAGFDADGFRGGRQKGGESKSEDFSLITRVDYTGVNGLLVGGSFSFGDHGHDQIGAGQNGDTEVFMYELHVDYRTGPWIFRALYSEADVDGTANFNNVNAGANLAEGMTGMYGELAFNVMSLIAPDSGAEINPFVRVEQINTQDSMAAGFVADPLQDNEIITFGVNYKPIPQVVIKADYENWDQDGKNDKFNIVFGYVF